MAKVGDVFLLIRNGASIKQTEGASGLPITRIETISSRVVDRNKMGYADVVDNGEYDDYILQDGDILMSHINSEKHLGKTAIYENLDSEKIIHGMNLLVLRCDERLIPKYAYYFFNSNRFIHQIPNITKKSVNQASFNVSALKQLYIPVPDKEVQKDIISVLDKVDNLCDCYNKQLNDLELLIKSRFIEMFGNPAINPNSYPVKSMDEIANYWNGLTYKPENVSNEGTIVLRSSNIQNGKLDFKDIVRVNCQIGEKKYVRNNDILMCSRNGSSKLVGKVALIESLTEPMCFGAFMMVIRSNYYPYLLTYFNTDAFRRQLSVGATTTINQITVNMLNKITVPVPPIEQVKEYSFFVNQVNKSKLEVQKSLEELETLKKSLMQQYFG